MKIYQCSQCNKFFYEYELIEEIYDVFSDWSIKIGEGEMFVCPECDGIEFVVYTDDHKLKFEEGMEEKYV